MSESKFKDEQMKLVNSSILVTVIHNMDTSAVKISPLSLVDHKFSSHIATKKKQYHGHHFSLIQH